MIKQIVCKECGKLHPAVHYSEAIYYDCGGEAIRESIDEYKERILHGDIE